MRYSCRNPLINKMVTNNGLNSLENIKKYLKSNIFYGYYIPDIQLSNIEEFIMLMIIEEFITLNETLQNK